MEDAMEWYLGVLKKYAVFDGRARRKEYWMFFLFNIIAAIILVVIDNVIGTVALLYGVYMLGILCPAIGGLWFLYLMVIDGNPGDNQYGPSPKAGAAA